MLFARVGRRAISSFSSYTSSTLQHVKRPSIHFGFTIVPEKHNFIVERFGKFHTVLQPGLRFLIPVIDQIAHSYSLKETVLQIGGQNAITQDNVHLSIDGVLYVRVHDPVKASYGVEDPYEAVVQLGQTTLRAEIGRMSLDATFAERDHLSARIVESVNAASEAWGMRVLRYELKDITPTQNIMQTMEIQAVAERKRRELILQAEGQAESIVIEANAVAEGIGLVSRAVERENGPDALRLRIAERYAAAFEKVSNGARVVVVPQAGPGQGAPGAVDHAAVVAQTLAIAGNVGSGGGVAAGKPSGATSAAAGRRDSRAQVIADMVDGTDGHQSSSSSSHPSSSYQQQQQQQQQPPRRAVTQAEIDRM